MKDKNFHSSFSSLNFQSFVYTSSLLKLTLHATSLLFYSHHTLGLAEGLMK